MIKEKESTVVKTKKVGVKYCGNCNPRIDSRAILRELEEALGGTFEFMSSGEKDLDGLIIFCGCPCACATPPVYDGPTIRVAGEIVDTKVCDKDRLTAIIQERLLEIVI